MSRPSPVTMPRPDGQSWFKLTNITGKAADMWIYDEIGGWGIGARDLVSELAGLNVAEIVVHVNSPGGDVFEGIAIMNALRDHPANITVKVDALAASIASVIAQAGNKVIMGRNSVMMIHNASGFAMGEAGDLRKMADLLDSTTENIASIYAERAGGTAKAWLAVMADETWYSADEAVAAGLADEVAPLPTERDAHQALARFSLSNYAKVPPALLSQQQDAYLDDPEPEPLEPIPWDPACFRDAMTASIPTPVVWDPSLFRAAIQIVAQDAPAPPPITTPEPAPVPGIDPLAFAAAIREARH